MFRALQNLLGAQPWKASHEVWAEPLAYSPGTGQVTFLFSTTPSVARDPQFLSRWGWQVRAMHADLYPPRTPTDAVLRNWVKGAARVNQVDCLLRSTVRAIAHRSDPVLFSQNLKLLAGTRVPHFHR